MKNSLLVIFITILVVGCTNTSIESKIDKSKESILIDTNNYSELIVLYKEQLRNREDHDTRVNLAEAYSHIGDYESSLFVISKLINIESSSRALFIQCDALFELGEIDKSEKCLLKVLELDKGNAEVENQLGIIYSYMGNVEKSKYYFKLARANFIDDVKIKNNLAMLFIIDGKFEQAVDLLLPIYLSERSNEKVRANLIFSLIKSDKEKMAEKILLNNYTQSEVKLIIENIQRSETLTVN